MRSLMLIVVGVALATSSAAEARPRRPATPSTSPAYAGGAGDYESRYPRRGQDIYSRQPGTSGTIMWNTPNASGNFGGPGAGGGPGGG